MHFSPVFCPFFKSFMHIFIENCVYLHFIYIYALNGKRRKYCKNTTFSLLSCKNGRFWPFFMQERAFSRILFKNTVKKFTKKYTQKKSSHSPQKPAKPCIACIFVIFLTNRKLSYPFALHSKIYLVKFSLLFIIHYSL